MFILQNSVLGFFFYFIFFIDIVAQILILMFKTICKCSEKKSRAGQKTFGTSAEWEHAKASLSDFLVM